MTDVILASIPSPAQGVWHVGPVPIRAYALCIVAGIIAALIIGDRRWAARGGEKGVIYDIALWAVPFGLIGGRLYHVITDWPTYFGDNGAGFVGALRIWDGGLGIWGAVALGGVGAWIGCRVRGIPLPAFGDAIAPGIILAQAIGRLGNYFNQELYGRETDLPWGLIIYDRENAAGQRDMLNGVSTGEPLFPHAVHPTFLYELLWNLLVFGVLLWADRRFRLGHGRLFALYVAGYCLGRFWIELMRSDHASLIAGIRVNTFTSMFVFIGAVIYIMAATKGREDPESLRGYERDDDDAPSPVDEAPADEPVLSGVAAKTAAAGSAAAVAGSGSVRDEPVTDDADAAEDVAEGDAEGDAAPVVDEPEPEPKSEVAAEAEDLAEAVENTPDEELIEAMEFSDALAEAPAESEDGIGAVDEDDVVEAQAQAAEVHQAAVEGAAESEALADEIAADSEALADEPADDDAEPVEAEPAEPAADSTVGSVESDEVADAVTDAPEVHEAAVDNAADSEALADETAEADDAEPVEAEPAEPATDSTVGSVESDEVADAVTDAPEVHEAAVENAADSEALADETAESDDAETVETEPEAELDTGSDGTPAAAPPAEKSRRRWWQRRS